MVWEQQVLVVVMTTRVVERGRAKCAQYWELEEGGVATYGNFKVTTTAVEEHTDYIVTSLKLTNLKVQHLKEYRSCILEWLHLPCLVPFLEDRT
jgi:tyrosine-protein phosphatase non-receptor type 9